MKKVSKLGVILTRSEQKMILGRRGLFCCEWCDDGSCNGWVDSPRTPCPIAASC
ncbi:hypothetical protein LXD69_09215 [Flavobacterium sediminilitoris]|uniref:Natural product n=1 Tax=Flavobacterium sediminilitoris TaxID=2024526 RepID=A0ABY4HIQ3_9FLAO|nr:MULTISPECIES: hypothetical protein [Flavobacterium]UOX32236.1 hypothetical protein LXD69_09215 [Flavobacterium sediminilitoris]